MTVSAEEYYAYINYYKPIFGNYKNYIKYVYSLNYNTLQADIKKWCYAKLI